MLESLTVEDFRPRVGDTYRLVPAVGDAVEAVLVSVEERGEAPPDHRAPFTLDFRAPATTTLEQGTYQVEHPDAGTLELFLVPIGPDAEGTLYQAVFG
ncbi:MAG TPA: hypothetical protein VFB78_12880 [Acidimicrobiales bacterium]|nr:hypothetical protein [Acidimicrobiales bacterium]